MIKCKEDVKNIGKNILGRDLTEKELGENTQAMEDYYEILLTEDCNNDEESAKALFDETFYEHLKEIITL